LEDKIVQRAVVEVLNAVYETDFVGFSYGFRPGRGPHDALDALAVGLTRKKVNWVLDADIRSFFTEIDREWMRRFLEHRIADKRVLRLIRKWLAAGIIEDGAWSDEGKGTPQGASVSPLLANVYLHYVFDLWAKAWRNRHATGDMIIVRFADDVVVGFQHERDARRFQDELRQRLAKFGLELAEDKTRLIEFGRFAAETGAGEVSESPRPSRSWGSCTSARPPGTASSSSSVTRSPNGCARSCASSTSRSSGAGICPSPSREHGWPAWCAATSPTTRCRPTASDEPVPVRGDPALVSPLAAPQPAHTPHLGTHAASPTLDTPGPRSSIPGPTSGLTVVPKAGAQCVSSARWDLCGGPPARAVPTASRTGARSAASAEAPALRRNVSREANAAGHG
jgi:hypothetical protein